jgi:hypothetical protein
MRGGSSRGAPECQRTAYFARIYGLLEHPLGDDAILKARPSYAKVYEVFNGFVASTKGQPFQSI